jgi:hypothetical protein
MNIKILNMSAPFMVMEDVIFNPRNTHHYDTISYNYIDKKLEFMVDIISNNIHVDTLIILLHNDKIKVSMLSKYADYIVMTSDNFKYQSYIRRLTKIIEEQTGKSLTDFTTSINVSMMPPL